VPGFEGGQPNVDQVHRQLAAEAAQLQLKTATQEV
jgi:hypothetical protein